MAALIELPDKQLAVKIPLMGPSNKHTLCFVRVLNINDYWRLGLLRPSQWENRWGWSAPAQLWPGDGKTARYG